MISFPKELPSITLQGGVSRTEAYAVLSNDFNPIHLNAEFAGQTPFGSPIAHGTMALNLLITVVENAVSPEFRIVESSIRFAAPARVGQALTTKGACVDTQTGVYDVAVTRPDGVEVLSGTLTLARTANSEAS